MAQVPPEGQGRLLVPMATPRCMLYTHRQQWGGGEGEGEALKGSEGSLGWLVSACTGVGVGERHCVYTLAWVHPCVRAPVCVCICVFVCVFACEFSSGVSYALLRLSLYTGREPPAYLCLLCFLRARLPTVCVE